MEDFITLKKINTNDEASTVIELLEKNNIEYAIEKQNASEDTEMEGEFGFELLIKVKPEDYEKASETIKDIQEIAIENLDKDFYLFAFADEELIEILQKPDEWSYNDYLWAQEILKQRGKKVSKHTLADWKQKRLEFLSQPLRISNTFLLTAYLFCFFGGIIGYFMGSNLWKSKKTLPNRKQILTYDEDSRKKGKSIKRIGLVCFFIWIIALIVLLINLMQG